MFTQQLSSAQPFHNAAGISFNAKPRVAAGFVTARRPALFQQSFNSFRQRCLDCHRLVDTWFAVDDFSTPAELQDMQVCARM